MRLRPYTAEDWDRVCQIHDAARRDELAAAGLPAAYLTREPTAENEGFHDYAIRVAVVGEQVVGIEQGVLPGNESFRVSVAVLRHPGAA